MMQNDATHALIMCHFVGAHFALSKRINLVLSIIFHARVLIKIKLKNFQILKFHKGEVAHETNSARE